MPKIPTSYYSRSERKKECKHDLNSFRINDNPDYHPLHMERSYVQALNQTKIDKFMAKPFISAFNFHREGIAHLDKDYSSNLFLTSSFDNQVVVFDIFNRKFVNRIQFDNYINSISIDSGKCFVSQSENVCCGKFDEAIGNFHTIAFPSSVSSTNVINNTLACGSYNNLYLADIVTSEILHNYAYDGDNVAIRFNKTFENILAVGNETSILLQDIRMNREIFVVNDGCLAIDFHENKFAYCSDNLKIVDMRNMKENFCWKKTVDKHTNVINAVNWSLDGTKIVTGSSDCTLRIEDFGNSDNQIYYNNRMGIVNGVAFSNCNSFILSASDDSSLRLWKSHPNNPSKFLTYQEKLSRTENEIIKNKFKDFPEIKEIRKHTFLPRKLKNEMKEKKEKKIAYLRKQTKNKNNKV